MLPTIQFPSQHTTLLHNWNYNFIDNPWRELNCSANKMGLSLDLTNEELFKTTYGGNVSYEVAVKEFIKMLYQLIETISDHYSINLRWYKGKYQCSSEKKCSKWTLESSTINFNQVCDSSVTLLLIYFDDLNQIKLQVLVNLMLLLRFFSQLVAYCFTTLIISWQMGRAVCNKVFCSRY